MALRTCILRSPSASATEAQLRAALPTGWTAEIITLGAPGEAHRRALDLTGIDVVVAAGGDGTIQEVASALVSRDDSLDLVIAPLGTANDYARHLGLIELDLQRVLSALGGASHPVDILSTPSAFSVNQITLGPPAQVTAETSAGLKAILGGVAYLASGLAALPGVQPLEASLQVDDDTWEGPALAISIANGCFGGGGLPMHPDAHLDDGLLDVLVIAAPLDPDTIVGVSADLLDGGTRQIRRWRGHRAVVRLPAGTPVNLDGEPSTCETLEVTVAPRALHLRLPPGLPAPGPVATGR